MISLIDLIARRAEAWALLRKGGLSGQIARAFLLQFGGERHRFECAVERAV